MSVGTKPDICFAVNRASRYLENPTKMHWNTVKRIIKYLKGTLRWGLKLEVNQDTQLQAWGYSDYAGEVGT